MDLYYIWLPEISKKIVKYQLLTILSVIRTKQKLQRGQTKSGSICFSLHLSNWIVLRQQPESKSKEMQSKTQKRDMFHLYKDVFPLHLRGLYIWTTLIFFPPYTLTSHCSNFLLPFSILSRSHPLLQDYSNKVTIIPLTSLQPKVLVSKTITKRHSQDLVIHNWKMKARDVQEYLIKASTVC